MLMRSVPHKIECAREQNMEIKQRSHPRTYYDYVILQVLSSEYFEYLKFSFDTISSRLFNIVINGLSFIAA